MKKVILSSLVIFLGVSLQAKSLSLQEAIDTAIQNNQNLKISKLGLEIADAQYKQAMSARYPQLNASYSATRLDEAPTYSLNGSIELPSELSSTLTIVGGIVVDAAGSYANNAGYTAAAAAVAGGSPNMSLPINIEAQLSGRDIFKSSLEATYPLYAGGKIEALIKQAKLNKSLQLEESKRSTAQVIYDVKKYYYAVLLTQKLYAESQKTLDRMKMVRDMTETFYQGGSLQVKKTDYLRTVTTVALIEAFTKELQSSVTLAKSALANSIGLSWNEEVEIASEEFETPKLSEALQSLVDQAYLYNPTYGKLHLALDIYDEKIKEAQSDYYPMIGLFGSVQHIDSNKDGGLINDTNKNSWTIGLGVKWNLFNGFRTSNEVQQARLEKMQLEHKEVLLKDGLALQLKHSFISIGQNKNQHDSLLEAKKASDENADLNIRAYQEDMVETKDVIEAQIMNSLTNASYYKNLHNFIMAKSQIELIINKELSK